MILDAYVEDMIYPLVVECSCARFQRIFFLSRVVKVACEPPKKVCKCKKVPFCIYAFKQNLYLCIVI